jgi:hypothetical protein
MATIESLDLAELQYNPDDVAAALADLLTVNGVTLADIIASLGSSSATQFVSKYNSSTNVLDNITLGNNVTGRGAVKFVSAGKPAVNLSGTAGVDYPAEGHTWVCYGILGAIYYDPSSAARMATGYGSPVLILQNSGDWSQNPPSAWIARDTGPDTDTVSTATSLDSSFSVAAGTDGTTGAALIPTNYTYTLDFENLN